MMKTGLKHRDVTARIGELKQRDAQCDSVVRRLDKERTRLEVEIQQYECILKTSAVRKTA